jgi:hypothetical protein
MISVNRGRVAVYRVQRRAAHKFIVCTIRAVHPVAHTRSRIPRTVECELTSDLVGQCVPGDVVTLSGEVKVAGDEQGHHAKDQTTFLLYILANSINKSVYYCSCCFFSPFCYLSIPVT